jgi:hypothetical protein
MFGETFQKFSSLVRYSITCRFITIAIRSRNNDSSKLKYTLEQPISVRLVRRWRPMDTDAFAAHRPHLALKHRTT